MATQVLGAVVAIAGILCIFVTADKSGQQPVFTLIGVVGLVGGLILWALGRIECAVQPPTPEQKKRFWLVSTLLLLLILLVAVGFGFVRFFAESGAPQRPAAKEFQGPERP